MEGYVKSLLAGLVAAAALSAAVAGASANRLSISSQSFRAIWTSFSFNAASRRVLCPTTLEGSFHSATIPKASELIGYVTRGAAGSICTGGSMTIRQGSLPWHIRYRAFSGILPRITLLIIEIVGARFRIEPTGSGVCEARSTAANPRVETINLGAMTGVAERLEPEANNRISLEEELGGPCLFAREGYFEGESQALTLLGATSRITVFLL